MLLLNLLTFLSVLLFEIVGFDLMTYKDGSSEVIYFTDFIVLKICVLFRVFTFVPHVPLILALYERNMNPFEKILN